MANEHHLQGMRTLNANRHLKRSVNFEANIYEVLLYTKNNRRKFPHLVCKLVEKSVNWQTWQHGQTYKY